MNILCCVVLGFVSFGLSNEESQGPPPATVCGAAAVVFVSNVSTLGLANSGSGMQDALDKATQEVLAQLAQASGVVCANCPNGLQCRRYAEADSGTFSAPQCEQNSTTGRWYCAISHTGKYKAGFRDC